MLEDLKLDLTKITFGDLYGSYIWETVRKPGLHCTYEKYREYIRSINCSMFNETLRFHVGKYPMHGYYNIPQLYLELQYAIDPLPEPSYSVAGSYKEANQHSLDLFTTIMQSTAMRTPIISKMDVFNGARLKEARINLDEVNDTNEKNLLTAYSNFVYTVSNGNYKFDYFAELFLAPKDIDELIYNIFGDATCDTDLLKSKSKGIHLTTRFATFDIQTSKGLLKIYNDFTDDFITYYMKPDLDDLDNLIEYPNMAFDDFKRNLFMSFVLNEWWKDNTLAAGTWVDNVDVTIKPLISSNYECTVYELYSKIENQYIGDEIDKRLRNQKHETELDESGKEIDNVNHPAHYESGKYECYDVYKANFGDAMTKGFVVGNVFKYLWRFRSKNGVEDLKKARWYLDKAIELYSDEE